MRGRRFCSIMVSLEQQSGARVAGVGLLPAYHFQRPKSLSRRQENGRELLAKQTEVFAFNHNCLGVRPVIPFLQPMLRSGHGRKGVNHGPSRAPAWQPRAVLADDVGSLEAQWFVLDSWQLMLDAGGMEAPRKRPWWRYLRHSVRGLMLVVLAVAGCLGWWLHLARVQRQAVAAIQAAGGSITYEWDVLGDPGTHGWRRWVAEHVNVDLTSNVVEVCLGPRCTDAELAQVALFDRLESGRNSRS
jgi:hypothetical protein